MEMLPFHRKAVPYWTKPAEQAAPVVLAQAEKRFSYGGKNQI